MREKTIHQVRGVGYRHQLLESDASYQRIGIAIVYLINS